MKGIELYRTTLKNDVGEIIDQVVIQELPTGLVFAMDASYVEQNINPIKSPYQNGTIELPEGDDDSQFEPDVLKREHGGELGVHPEVPLSDWINATKLGQTRDGYWEYASSVLLAREKGQIELHQSHQKVAGITFSKYGDIVPVITLESLINDVNCISRVEESGSEGYYVEVIRWDEEDGWVRHAFKKLFKLQVARTVEQLINANCATIPVFHTLHKAHPLASCAT